MMNKIVGKLVIAIPIILTLVLCGCTSVNVSKPSSGVAEPASDEAPLYQPDYIKEGVDVVAVFAGIGAQPLIASDGNTRKLDTLWLFFSDSTFIQYAETFGNYDHFSTGKYSFKDNGSFIIDENKDNGIIVIERNKKYAPEKFGLADYSSIHEYKLGTLGFKQLYGPDSDRQIVAIYSDPLHEEYISDDGTIYHLDSFWLFFNDGSFSQYAILNGDIITFSSGNYQFDESGDFHATLFSKDKGRITLKREYLLDNDGEKTETYDLATTGHKCLFELTQK